MKSFPVELRLEVKAKDRAEAEEKARELAHSLESRRDNVERAELWEVRDA